MQDGFWKYSTLFWFPAGIQNRKIKTAIQKMWIWTELDAREYYAIISFNLKLIMSLHLSKSFVSPDEHQSPHSFVISTVVPQWVFCFFFNFVRSGQSKRMSLNGCGAVKKNKSFTRQSCTNHVTMTINAFQFLIYGAQMGCDTLWTLGRGRS